ncbi:MAG: hypothetical protein ACO1SV_19570 [Fimbriimonas sp.]
MADLVKIDVKSGAASEDVKFINKIESAIDQGYSFIPFVGAGFSAPSGAPLIRGIADYLIFCIVVAIRAYDHPSDVYRKYGIRTAEKLDDMEAWNPQTDAWPPYDHPRRLDLSGSWRAHLSDYLGLKQDERLNAEEDYEDWLNDQQYTANPDEHDKAWRLRRAAQDAETIASMAYAASGDWRESLRFLASLRRRAGDRIGTPFIGTVDPNVIDTFFREVVVAKRQPALTHRMLGTLAGPLNIEVVLTTNFDDLTERGFEMARNPLQLFEITPGAPLPSAALLRNRQSLIKLNGGRFALRADYSVDEPLSIEECETIRSYFLADGLPSEASGRVGASQRRQIYDSHLLIVGCGGVEARTWSWIEHLVRNADDHFKVFWIAYSKTDYDVIHDKVRNSLKDSLKFQSRFEILRHSEPGLLLMELYQVLRRTVPPLGSIFPSPGRLTLPPRSESRDIEEALNQPQIDSKLDTYPAVWNRFQKELRDAVLRPSKPGRPDNNIILAYSEEGVRGVGQIASVVFRDLQSDQPDITPIWVSFSSVASARHLYDVILEAVQYRLGVEDWIPSALPYQPFDKIDFSAQGEEIARLLKLSPNTWVFFLDLRDDPGANFREGLLSGNVPEGPNRWVDSEPREEQMVTYETATLRHFAALVKRLVGSHPTSDGDGLRAPRENTFPPKVKVVIVGWSSEVLVAKLDPHPVVLKKLAGSSPSDSHRPSSADDILKNCIKWLKDGPKMEFGRRRFLLGLVLQRRPRYPAVTYSAALDRQGEHVGEVGKWLGELTEAGLVRRQEGGLIWLRTDVRDRLRDVLREPWGLELNQDAPPSKRAKVSQEDDDDPEACHLGRVHRSLARWYEKVIEASDSPEAVFETAEHYLMSAYEHLRAIETLGARGEYELGRAHSMLVATKSILLDNAYLVQTRGYYRASIRYLSHLATLGDKILKILVDHKEAGVLPLDKLDCVLEVAYEGILAGAELGRAISREVGEGAEARSYQRMCGILMLRMNRPGSQDRMNADGAYRFAFPGFLSNAITESTLKGQLRKASRERVEFFRWMRWSAMLSLESRDYDAVEQLIFDKREGKDHWLLGPQDRQRKRGQNDLKNVHAFDDDTCARTEFLRVLLIGAEIQVIRMRLSHRLAVMGMEDEKTWIARAEKARAVIARGRRLAFSVRHLAATGSREAQLADWCEARFRMFLSSVEAFSLNGLPKSKKVGRRSSRSEQDRLERALGELSDAEAMLSNVDPQRVEVDRAFVDLHRSDAYLAVCDGSAYKLSPSRFLHPTKLLEGFPNFEDYAEALKNFDSRFGRRGAPRRSSVLKSYAKHSNRFLARAESSLRKHRRNVWWMTWYFDRKLRTIAIAVLASGSEPDSPIPFLGLEDAMRLSSTEADRVFEDAMRMIRVDAFRLANVIETYFACLMALLFRLSLPTHQSAPRMPNRLSKMEKLLWRALKRLEDMREENSEEYRRDVSLTDRLGPFGEKSDVGRYVDEILKIREVMDRDEFKRLYERATRSDVEASS